MKTIPECLSIKVGCHIDGNFMNVDEFNLEIIGIAEQFGFDEHALAAEESEDYSQELTELADSAVDYLNDNTIDHRPPFTYWTVENSMLLLDVDFVSAQESEDVVCADWRNNPAPSYILEINDHGNVTLYSIERKEVWAVV